MPNLQGLQDDRKAAVHIVQDVVVSEAQHPEALALKPCRALGVGLACRVLSAIDFDDEPA